MGKGTPSYGEAYAAQLDSTAHGGETGTRAKEGRSLTKPGRGGVREGPPGLSTGAVWGAGGVGKEQLLREGQGGVAGRRVWNRVSFGGHARRRLCEIARSARNPRV